MSTGRTARAPFSRGRQADERGAMLVLAAVGMVVAMIAAGLAIDIGRLASYARTDQKVADLAALDAVRVLPTDPTAAAQASAARNGFPTSAGYSVAAVEGVKSGGACQALSGAGSVCVTVTSPHTNTFPFLGGRTSVTRVAVAVNNDSEAQFSIGSTLASLDTQKSALDSVLGSDLGVSMSLVSYSGLAGGSVTLAALQTQLASLGYSVGTPTTLLSTNVKVKDLFTATGSALSAQGNSTAAAAVNNIPIASIAGSLTIQLGKLIALATPTPTNALSTSINAFQLVTGSAELQNGSSFVNIPGISVSVPLLTSLTVGLKVISPAQIAEGPVGTTAKNSQIDLKLSFQLSVAGIGLVSVVLDESNANAVGTLTAIRCSSTPGVTISALTSSIATSGTVNTGVTILTVTGSAAGTSANSHDFAYTSDFVPPVGTGTYWATGAAQMGINNSVTVTGTGLLGPPAALLVQPVLNATLPLLDVALSTALKPVLRALGANLAEADVTAMDIFPTPPTCGRPGLVG